jgi:hypothetical protein
MDFKLGIAHNVLYPFFLPVEKHGFVYQPVSVTPNINLDYRVIQSCAQSKAEKLNWVYYSLKASSRARKQLR